MKLAATISRYLLGAIFLVFGLNGFFNFLPQPALPAAAGAFLGALASAGYVFPLLKAAETLSAIALLSGRYVPLAMVVLAPIITNITLFHVFLTGVNPGSLGMPFVMIITGSIIAWYHRDRYRSLLSP